MPVEGYVSKGAKGEANCTGLIGCRQEIEEGVMGYLVAAYGVLWAVSFGLVFSIVLRQRKLRSELAALRLMIEDELPFDQDE
jgi:hypothetical protein